MKRIAESVDDIALALIDVLFNMKEIDAETYYKIKVLYGEPVKAVTE